jgi:hypothetical protein
MCQSHVLGLAVLDREDQRLIGIISAADLAGASEGRPCEVIFHRTFRDHYGHARELPVSFLQNDAHAQFEYRGDPRAPIVPKTSNQTSRMK